MPNSKSKGNSAERWAADLLSDWWGKPFKRIPSSGALRWGGLTDTFGDLLVPEDFKFVVECKHRKNFDLLALLHKKPAKDNILGWYLQSVEDAQRSYKELGIVRAPLLIAKGNRQTPVIMLPYPGLPLPKTHLIVVNPYIPTSAIAPLADFLKEVTPDRLRVAMESWDSGVLSWELPSGRYANTSNKVGSGKRSRGSGSPSSPQDSMEALPGPT